MIVRRYNIVNGKYSKVTILNSWNVVTTVEDADTNINCIHCGQNIAFGDSFESMRYKDQFDQGYRECKTCYNNFLPLTNFHHKELLGKYII